MRKLLLLLTLVLLSQNTMASLSKSNINLDQNIGVILDEIENKLIEQASEALQLTQMSLLDIKSKDYKTSVKKLELVRKTLIDYRNKNPQKTNILVDFDIKINDTNKNNRQIKNQITRAQNALNISKIQKAKTILNELESTLDVTETYFNINEYIEMITKAKELIKAKNFEKAQLIIIEALGSFDEKEVSFPLPLITAYNKVKDLDSNLSNEEYSYRKALSAISDIEYDLERAKILGYSVDNLAYTKLVQNLKDLKTKLKEKTRPKSLMSTIVRSVKTWKNNFFKRSR